MAKKAPSYRCRKGYDQAIVTLTDAVTRKRRDFWLGEYGSTQSRELYHRVLSEWERNGRRWPEPPTEDMNGVVGAAGMTVAEVIHAYWRWARSLRYTQGELSSVLVACRLLRRFYGSTPAAKFGPKKMRLLRDEMVKGGPDEDPPREPWSRPYINAQVRRLRAVFKWAGGQELIPASVYEQLRLMEPLKRGRTEAYEPAPVLPVPLDMVEAIKPFVSRQVWALIQLQLHTGARGGELCQLRSIDLDMDDDAGVWLYRPSSHKNAHRGKTRTIYFGPQAQAVIRPFLEGRAITACLFSPAEAEMERLAKREARRKTPMSCGNRSGTNRRDDPEKTAGDHYTPESYGRAIQYACDKAYPPPAELARQKVLGRGRKKGALRCETYKKWKRRLGPEAWAKLRAWQREHRWHPHQLRHAAGTRIRREFGLEAAQLALGHSSALITDAVYAERDLAKVVEVMRKIG